MKRKRLYCSYTAPRTPIAWLSRKRADLVSLLLWCV
jgi:hypothetical protein